YKRREDVPLSPPRSTDALSPDPPACPPSTASTPSCSWSPPTCSRSEEHTSELQSRENLVCRLLLEKKKTPTLPSPLHRSRHPRSAHHPRTARPLSPLLSI